MIYPKPNMSSNSLVNNGSGKRDFETIVIKQELVLPDESQMALQTSVPEQVNIKIEELSDEFCTAPHLMEQYLVENDFDDDSLNQDIGNNEAYFANGHDSNCELSTGILSNTNDQHKSEGYCNSCQKPIENIARIMYGKQLVCEVCQNLPSVNFIGHKLIQDEKSFSCEICQKLFSRASNVRRHKRIHTGEKPFICNLCEKCFADKSDLTRHKLIHTGEKPFTCEFCKKSFSRSSNLATHRKHHTGETPFSCEVCSKGFTSLSHLIQHEKIHTGEKPFSCDICSKAFGTNSHLVKHKRTHTGEKPFSCQVCQKNFTTSTHLVQHLRIHTGERPFSCPVCQVAFTNSSTLSRHKKIHEGKKLVKCEGLNPVKEKQINDKQDCEGEDEDSRDKMHSCDADDIVEEKSISSDYDEEYLEKPLPCEIVEVFVKEKSLSCDSEEDLPTSDVEESNVQRKPMSCDVCQKSFSRLSNLRRHKIVHID